MIGVGSLEREIRRHREAFDRLCFSSLRVWFTPTDTDRGGKGDKRARVANLRRSVYICIYTIYICVCVCAHTLQLTTLSGALSTYTGKGVEAIESWCTASSSISIQVVKNEHRFLCERKACPAVGIHIAIIFFCRSTWTYDGPDLTSAQSKIERNQTRTDQREQTRDTAAAESRWSGASAAKRPLMIVNMAGRCNCPFSSPEGAT